MRHVQESSKQKAVLPVKMEDSRQVSQEEREERRIQGVAKAKGKELPSVVLEKYGSRRHAAPQASRIHGCVLLSVQTREISLPTRIGNGITGVLYVANP